MHVKKHMHFAFGQTPRECDLERNFYISARLSKLRIGHFQKHTDWIFTQYIILPFANKSKPSGEKNIKRDWLIRLPCWDFPSSDRFSVGSAKT
jgi:hypothetical protein